MPPSAFRVLKPLAEKLGIEKLNFQIPRRSMATQAKRMGAVKDIQAHPRHARPETTAYEYMQELPDGVLQMVKFGVRDALERRRLSKGVVRRLPMHQGICL